MIHYTDGNLLIIFIFIIYNYDINIYKLQKSVNLVDIIHIDKIEI